MSDTPTRYSNGRKRATTAPTQFAAVDGEGGDIKGRHEYLLLRAGDHLLETGAPLRTEECLSFLASLPTDRIYISYYFDYDVTMMLRHVKVSRLQRLLDRESRKMKDRPCSSYPVDIGDFRIDYLAGKEFRIKWKAAKRWVIISDVSSFFQSSFVIALMKWFNDEPDLKAVIDKIAEGKDLRNEFGAITEYEREYNKIECKMLERLMSKFRSICASLNLSPMKWQGPGHLVSALFRKVGLPRNKDITLFDTHPELIGLANAAYIGGRFEPPKIGDIPGPIYQSDLNSAYAASYRRLPCLIHGQWKPITTLPPLATTPEQDVLFIGMVSYAHDAGWNVYPLPCRTDKGTIIFPRIGEGAYWSHEINVARRHGSNITLQSGYQYVTTCDCAWFDWVNEMYQRRLELGKTGQGMVLKIALASCYGKLAQSVGCAPYSNPIWAGNITSMTRAALIDAALQVPGGNDVIMLATDGLFTQQPRDLPTGTQLGEWDVQVHDSIFVVQSGVYFLPGDAGIKTRGVPKGKIMERESDFRTIWQHYLDTGDLQTIEVALHNFYGLRIALHRGKPEIAGTWEDVSKEIGFDWQTKRTFRRIVGTYVETWPAGTDAYNISQPYDRVIGGMQVAKRLETADQPDWGDCL